MEDEGDGGNAALLLDRTSSDARLSTGESMGETPMPRGGVCGGGGETLRSCWIGLRPVLAWVHARPWARLPMRRVGGRALSVDG